MNDQEQIENNLSPEIPETTEREQTVEVQQLIGPEYIKVDAEEKISEISAAAEKAETTPAYQEKTLTEAEGDKTEVIKRTQGIDKKIEAVKQEAEAAITEWVKLEKPQFDENNFYRVVDKAGYDDFKKTTIVRSSPSGTPPVMQNGIDIGSRPTAFPTFAKGKPLDAFLEKHDVSYVLESDSPMYKAGDEHPLSGKKIGGRHGGYRPLDEQGKEITEMPAETIKNIYKIDRGGDVYIEKSGSMPENKVETAEYSWLKLDKPEFDENNFYRVINEAGYEDMIKNSIVRSSPEGTEPLLTGRFGLVSGRPTSFPSFDKGKPSYSYLEKGKNNYILESAIPMYRRGDLNPVTGKEIRGRHWAYRPLDETGQIITKMKPEMLKNVYKVDAAGNTYIRQRATKDHKEEREISDL